MPELPEVETIVRSLREKITGHTISGVTILFPGIAGVPDGEFEQSIFNARIVKVSRRAKLIMLDLDNRCSILIHLGMTGKVTIEGPDATARKHTHVILALTPPASLRYEDIRRFGYIRVIESDDVPGYFKAKGLGSEPLEISLDIFCLGLSGRRGGIKGLLLNQRLVVGIGNIYADEILHRAGVHPLTQAHRITASKRKMLHTSMVEVLEEAIEQKGSSISDYVDTEGKAGNYQNFHKVYQRTGQPCHTCGTEIIRKIIAGRSTHYCGVCQSRKK